MFDYYYWFEQSIFGGEVISWEGSETFGGKDYIRKEPAKRFIDSYNWHPNKSSLTILPEREVKINDQYSNGIRLFFFETYLSKISLVIKEHGSKETRNSARNKLERTIGSYIFKKIYDNINDEYNKCYLITNQDYQDMVDSIKEWDNKNYEN